MLEASGVETNDRGTPERKDHFYGCKAAFRADFCLKTLKNSAQNKGDNEARNNF